MTNSILGKTLAFAVATMISRLTGLLRDGLFAGYFGTSEQYDAYLIAILIPFFLRKIFAEGAMTLSFVPLFNERMRVSRKRAQVFATTTIVIVCVIAGAVTLGGIIFSRPLSYAFAGPLSDEVVELTAYLMRISFPFVLLVSLWAVFYGILNSLDAFFVAAFSPAIINLTTILGITLSSRTDPAILGATIGFVVGGLAQLMLLMFFVRRAGFKITPSFSKQDAKQFLLFFAVASIAPAINQINSLVDVRVATELGSGVVATLQYAMRIYQLPLGVFAVAVATVALPELSRENVDHEAFTRSLWKLLRLLLFLLLPATLALFALRAGIVSLLFERGAFTTEDTLATSMLLAAYAIGLPFYGGFGVLSRAYYAKKNAKLPSLITVLMVAVNVILDILLGLTIGPIGIALATSIAGITGFSVLAVLLLKSSKPSGRDLSSIGKTVFSSALMIISVVVLRGILVPGNVTTLLLLTAATLSFLFVSWIIGSEEITELRTIFSLKRQRRRNR